MYPPAHFIFIFGKLLKRHPQTFGDFAPTYISSHVYKIQALSPNHSAMITPSKSNSHGLVSPNTHSPSCPISSTFLFSLITSLLSQGTYSYSATQPREAAACSGPAPGVKPCSGGLHLHAFPDARQGAGWPGSLGDRGSKDQIRCPCTCACSGRHCRALCELLRERHSVSRGATDTRHSRVTALGVCPLESYNPLELWGFTNQKQATAMGGLRDEVEAGTVGVRGGAGGRLRVSNRSSGARRGRGP